MNHLDDAANRLLTEAWTSKPDGTVPGPAASQLGSQEQAGVKPGKGEGPAKPGPVPASNTAVSGLPQAGSPASEPEPGLKTGFRGTWPKTYCLHCDKVVQPEDDSHGQCPHCHRAVPGSALAKKRNPARAHRTKELCKSLIEDYAPQNTAERHACMQLADALERLEVERAGTTEWARLHDKREKLINELNAVLAARKAATKDRDVVVRNIIVHADLVDGKLIERPGTERIVHDDGTEEYTNATTALQPSTTAQCPWCHQTPCVGREHRSYDALHHLDPEHVAAREKQATAEMFESLRRKTEPRF